jgi:hypothetical protein
MTINEVKQKGVLYASNLNRQLYLVIGKWNQLAKKPNRHWCMVTDDTNIKIITNTSNRMDEDIKSMACINSYMVSRFISNSILSMV